jgi:hypothetical protein
VTVTTFNRCAARARTESAARTLSRRALSGAATCCAAAHAGAATQAHTNNCRNMVSTSLEFGDAGMSRSHARAGRTRRSSAASDVRRAEWRRETKRRLAPRADDFRGMLDHHRDVRIRRNDHDERLLHVGADRARAHAIVAARVPRRRRAAVLRARMLMRVHGHSAAMLHAGYRMRRHHRWARGNDRDGEHRGEGAAHGGDDRSNHETMIDGI